MSSVSNNLNLNKLDDFLNTDGPTTLIINQISEEIGLFYLYVIKYLTIKKNINLIFEDNILEEIEAGDLFGNKRKIRIYNQTNLKTIDRIIKSKSQNIIFADYKIFKKYQGMNDCINGYSFEEDIKYFLQDILKVNDKELLNYCREHPYFTYSEVSKFIINSQGYEKDANINSDRSFILEIRKDIFRNKNKSSLINIFSKIKEEALYKKFSFLTY